MNRQEGKKLLLMVVFLMLPLIFSQACIVGVEPTTPPVQIRNNTAQILSIYLDGSYIGDVAPGAEIKNYKVYVKDNFKVEAKNTQGEIIYSKNLTLEEVKKVNWKIIIEATAGS